jgi:hypothetical protein
MEKVIRILIGSPGKIPLNPPLPKGDLTPPLEKGGEGGIFTLRGSPLGYRGLIREFISIEYRPSFFYSNLIESLVFSRRLDSFLL